MQFDPALLAGFKARFADDKASQTVAHAIAKNGIAESSLDQKVLREHDFMFSHSIKEAEITNQKSSGRCWMFASYNVLRLQVMKKLNIETFEFSEVYLFFMDKIEKANSFLEFMIEFRDEPLDSRLMTAMLDHSVSDGNWWEGFDSLVNKYGAVPKGVMPETFDSSKSGVLVEQLDLRLKRSAARIRKAHSEGADLEQLRAIKEEALYEVYNICTKSLGALPERFDYSYTDKDKKFHKLAGLTPKRFYEEYCGSYFANKVSLIEDPRGIYPYARRIELKYWRSIVGGSRISSINVPQAELKKAVIASLKDGEAVWFACDVAKNLDRKLGIMDDRLFAYDQTLTELGEFSRSERIDYRYTYLTHAMTFVGVDLNADGEPRMWQVENSWGDEYGKKGIFSMSDSWFDNENIMIIVDKKYVDARYLKALDEEPIMIEPWDAFAAMLKH